MFYTAMSQQNGRMRPYWHGGDMPRAFNPGGHAALVAWHDAAQAVYTTTSRTTLATTNDPVGSWTDLKNSRHANQATSGKRPALKMAGGLPVVEFSSANSTALRGIEDIGIVDDEPFTLITSMKFLIDTMYGTVMGLGPEVGYGSMFKIQQYTTDMLYMNLNGPNYEVTAVDFTDAFHVISVVYNGTNIRTHVDGNLVDSTAMGMNLLDSPLQLGFSIGSLGDAQFSDIQMSEAFVFGAALSDGDREQYEQFLAVKMI